MDTKQLPTYSPAPFLIGIPGWSIQQARAQAEAQANKDQCPWYIYPSPDAEGYRIDSTPAYANCTAVEAILPTVIASKDETNNDNLFRARVNDRTAVLKIKKIAEIEERPIGRQVTIVLREYVAAYEREHGEIEIDG